MDGDKSRLTTAESSPRKLAPAIGPCVQKSHIQKPAGSRSERRSPSTRQQDSLLAAKLPLWSSENRFLPASISSDKNRPFLGSSNPDAQWPKSIARKREASSPQEALEAVRETQCFCPLGLAHFPYPAAETNVQAAPSENTALMPLEPCSCCGRCGGSGRTRSRSRGCAPGP